MQVTGFTRLCSLLLMSAVILSVQAANETLTGTVERVWDDGFQLNSAGRQVLVDSYDLCGDNTHRHLNTGEQVTVSGEFEDGEFDAFTITRNDGGQVCH